MHPILQERMEAMARAFVASIMPWFEAFWWLLVVLMLVCGASMLWRWQSRSTTGSTGGSGEVARDGERHGSSNERRPEVVACRRSRLCVLLPVLFALGCAAGDEPNRDATAAGTGGETGPTPGTATPPTITITATDFTFDAPDTVMAGWTTIRLLNHGGQPHAATLVRLEAGRTLADYIQTYGNARRTRAVRPDWVRFAGGAVAFPHGEGSATLYLEPGNHAWICPVPGPDGTPHLLQHNHAHAFAVQPDSGHAPSPSVPEPTASWRMHDFSFELTGPLEEGKHVIRIANMGVEPHHLLLFKLESGRTPAEFQAWTESSMQGEPPAAFVEAMGELSTGAEGYLDVDLSAGDYVLICLVAGQDEVPHSAKGMVRHMRVE